MSDHACPDHRPKPAEHPVLDLEPAALFVVLALRAWVAPHMRPGAEHPDWREAFRIAGVPAPGAVGFDAMMSVVGGHAKRLLEVRCCACPSLGADEAEMINLVSALQSGDGPGALAVLSDWLSPEAVEPALGGARRFAATMASAGMRLPPGFRPGGLAAGAPAGVTLH